MRQSQMLKCSLKSQQILDVSNGNFYKDGEIKLLLTFHASLTTHRTD